MVELGHYVAAPFCTRILADLGAEVVKVEPPGGDPFRGWGEAKDGHSLWFSIHGRNKLSIELDLKKDRETLLKLAARADVLVENMRAGQLERLKIGPAELHAVNPRLVIARISGYGQDGPYRDKPAFGAIGEAIGGLRHLTGHPSGATDLPPPRCGISISDDLAGLYAAIGLLAAVWERDAVGSGKGRVIDVNLVDSVFSLMEGMLPEYALDGRVRQPVGAAIPTASPTNTYACADGRWLCIAGNSDPIFARLMTAIGRPELAKDPAYATNGLRCRNRERAGHRHRRLDAHFAGARGRGNPGTRRRPVFAPVRHRRLRHRPALPRPQSGATGRRPVDRPDPASRPGHSHGRGGARGCRALDRSRVGRSHGFRAPDASGPDAEIHLTA